MGPLRPFICENGTYRIQTGIFKTTERVSSLEFRPPPFPEGFNTAWRGRVRDRISLVGRFNSGRSGEDAVFAIEDRGTCRQFATVAGQPNVVVSEPFFEFPFNAPLTTPDDDSDD